jgi:thiamine kinase-like enzyme
MAQKRLGDAVQLPVILDAVKKSFSLSGLDTSQLCSFADRIEDLSSSGAPYGLCHGDLSVGNLLVDDNTIFIVDWERARFDMVFADLVKLFRQIPGLKARLAARFDEWNGAQTLSPLGMMDQMALGSMIHMANMWDRYSGVLGTREESILASLRKEKVQYYAKRLAADLSRLVAV